MADYIFPAGDSDSPRTLLAQLGSFWSELYRGQPEVLDLMTARSELEQQVRQNLNEAIQSVSRLTIPVLHRQNWKLLTIRESEVVVDTSAVPVYGGGDNYGPTPFQERYGIASQVAYRVSIDSDVKDVGMVSNRLTDPSLVWVNGVQFVQDGAELVFRDNPFDHPYLGITPIWEDGEIVDREGYLWMFRAGIDREDLYIQFGYVLSIYQPSSESYRTLLNAVADCLVRGSALASVEELLAAAANIRLVQEPEETVELIAEEGDYQLIITDAHVYRFPAATTAAVAVGDTVTAGQSLIQEFKVLELNTGTSSEALPALTIGKGLLAAGFLGELQFNNTTTDLNVDTSHISGRTYVSFDLGGHPLDVIEFFDRVHTAGIAQGSTLANLLDQRTTPVDEPTADMLPATINPLEFLVDNLLRGNAFVVRLGASVFGDSQSRLDYVRLLRRVLPPQTTVLILLELPLQEDTVPIPGDGDLSLFYGAGPTSDSFPTPVDTTEIGAYGFFCV